MAEVPLHAWFAALTATLAGTLRASDKIFEKLQKIDANARQLSTKYMFIDHVTSKDALAVVSKFQVMQTANTGNIFQT